MGSHRVVDVLMIRGVLVRRFHFTNDGRGKISHCLMIGVDVIHGLDLDFLLFV